MKRLVAVVLGLSACLQADVSVETSEVAAGSHYVVVFRSDLVPSDASKRIAKAGGSTQRSLRHVGIVLATGNETFAAKLAADPAVLAVGREHMSKLLPTQRHAAGDLTSAATANGDPYSLIQWDMERVGAPAVWARQTPAASVAVIDTGVMDDHPDLDGQLCAKIATNYCQASGGTYNSPSYPIYNAVIDFDTGAFCEPADPTFEFHGTHVAGTVAAARNGYGVVGVAPTACVAAYKVFDRFRFTDEHGNRVEALGAFDFPLFDAIIHATQNGHKVINMSLGGVIDRSSRDGNAAYLAFERVTRWANRNGTVIVAAAGNETTNNNGTIAFVPSDFATVLSVSATGSNQLVWDGDGLVAAPGSDVLAFYSNYGAAVDISAPGGDCGPNGYPLNESCDPFHLILSSCISPWGDAEHCWAAGTSMAAPHVAAAAALVRGIHPDWTPGLVRSQLKDTAEVVGARQGFGAGLLNVDAAAN